MRIPAGQFPLHESPGGKSQALHAKHHRFPLGALRREGRQFIQDARQQLPPVEPPGFGKDHIKSPHDQQGGADPCGGDGLRVCQERHPLAHDQTRHGGGAEDHQQDGDNPHPVQLRPKPHRAVAETGIEAHERAENMPEAGLLGTLAYVHAAKPWACEGNQFGQRRLPLPPDPVIEDGIHREAPVTVRTARLVSQRHAAPSHREEKEMRPKRKLLQQADPRLETGGTFFRHAAKGMSRHPRSENEKHNY